MTLEHYLKFSTLVLLRSCCLHPGYPFLCDSLEWLQALCGGCIWGMRGHLTKNQKAPLLSTFNSFVEVVTYLLQSKFFSGIALPIICVSMECYVRYSHRQRIQLIEPDSCQ